MTDKLIELANHTWHLTVYIRIIETAYARVEGIKTLAGRRRKAEQLLGYVEAHHILPRSISPEHIKDHSNLAYLTPREHFICHMLLAKMFADTKYSHKMLTAVKWLSNKYKINSVAYNALKARAIESNREMAKKFTPEHKAKFMQAGCEAGKLVRQANVHKWVNQSLRSEEAKVKAVTTQKTAAHRQACSRRELAKNKEDRKHLAKQGQLALMVKCGGEEGYRKYLSDRIKGRKKYINPMSGQVRILHEPIDGFILASSLA